MKKIISIIVLILIISPISVMGENDDQETSTSTQNTTRTREDEIRKRQDETRREQVKRNFEIRREEFKDEVEERREQMRERMEEHRAELKERLQNVKDTRKRMVVERIQINLDALNERMINHFTNVVDKLEKALERIISRTDKAEDRGLNVSSVRTAISAAQSAIDAARAAITAQAGKTYPVEVNEEDDLKADVGGSRKALHTDLKKLHQVIKAAHEAVRKAATTLAKIPRVDQDTVPTTTPSTTNP